MTIISNSQSFSTLPSGLLINMRSDFKNSMDTVLTGLGRNITIHLPAGKSPCPSSDCKYNSTYQRYTGINGKICEACKGQGFIVEPRQTIYLANIRWTNEPFNQANSNIKEISPAGRIGSDFVRTKTVYSSMDHVRKSIGCTIDGINVELFKEPRPIAFGDLLYTISWWKVVNR